MKKIGSKRNFPPAMLYGNFSLVMPRGTLLDFDISLGTNKTKQKATEKWSANLIWWNNMLYAEGKLGK